MKVKSESEVAQSRPTLSDPMGYGSPGSSVHGIFQARVLEWGAIAFSKGLNLGPFNPPPPVRVPNTDYQQIPRILSFNQVQPSSYFL